MIIAILLILIALLLSSEQFRRGAYADDYEIYERAERGESGCGLMVWATLACLGGMALLGMAGGL